MSDKVTMYARYDLTEKTPEFEDLVHGLAEELRGMGAFAMYESIEKLDRRARSQLKAVDQEVTVSITFEVIKLDTDRQHDN